MTREITVVGVDVSGRRKGFHAVALSGMMFRKNAFEDPADVVRWCRELGAELVAVDAPCGWSASGRSRLAERSLQFGGERIHCFATPTLDRALHCESNFYEWVFNGMELYAALGKHYTLFEGDTSVRPLCFETFPQAIACALAGQKVPAKDKAAVRRKVLSDAGYDHNALPNIDFIDAALCAVMATRFRQGACRSFGQADEGFIVISS